MIRVFRDFRALIANIFNARNLPISYSSVDVVRLVVEVVRMIVVKETSPGKTSLPHAVRRSFCRRA